MSIRVTPMQRAAFEAAARESGRSLSSEVLARAYSTVEELPNQPEHLRALGDLAKLVAGRIEQLTGKRWIEDAFTANAVRQAIDIALGHFAPQWESGGPLPDQLERLTKAMPPEVLETYRRPTGLALVQATNITAWIESAHKTEPPTEMSDPFDPIAVRRRLFRDLIRSKEKSQ
jgi:hypothetical protein